MVKSQRDGVLDTLKGLCLLCIVIAHISPPGWLFQLRNFDVPFIVMLSGVAFTSFSKSSRGGYLRYCLIRCERLVLPVWIFFTFLFLFVYFFTTFTSTTFPWSLREIAGTYFLLDGVGFRVDNKGISSGFFDGTFF